MRNLTAIILETREEFVENGFASSYQDINCGPCVYFSEIVQKKLDDACFLLSSDTFNEDSWSDEFTWDEGALMKYHSLPPNTLSTDDLNNMSFGYHQWVYYKGKHYDSESPSGVENLFDLPFYRRILFPCHHI